MEERTEFNDHRIFARFAARFPLRFLDSNTSREGDAMVRDVSAKGLGLVASEALAPLTPLEMWLDIPDKGEPLYVRGEVAWSKKLDADQYRIGVNLERADLMGLSRVLRVI